MGKISPVYAKYIIHLQMDADGVVDKPDVIGAIFGQTEGLLGQELDLRDLQKTGRIGRIEVELETKGGKTTGHIIVPSSMDMAETAIIAAALETIERVGPCNAKMRVIDIEDVRETKRQYIINRARELLKRIVERMPEASELLEKLKESIRMMELIEYGPEKLPAGPGIDESDEIIIVEGRADVLNLLKHGIRNVIAINGTSIPKTIIELSKKKTSIAFVDGDRGGLLILKELLQVADIDFVARAPQGKEVEELTNKEIYKALRAKVPVDQFLQEIGMKKERKKVAPELARKIKRFIEDIEGSGGALILNENWQILGKVPVKDLIKTLRNLEEAYIVIMDGTVTQDIVEAAKRSNVAIISASKVRARGNGVVVLEWRDL